MKIVIPKTFQILGHTIAVRYDPKFRASTGSLGEARHAVHEIILQPDCSGVSLPSQLEHTYLHEVVHIILSTMNDKKNNSEAFVDVFSGLLHQVLTTSAGQVDEP